MMASSDVKAEAEALEEAVDKIINLCYSDEEKSLLDNREDAVTSDNFRYRVSQKKTTFFCPIYTLDLLH